MPVVGLTQGELLQGLRHGERKWVTTTLAGLKDSLQSAGGQPPDHLDLKQAFQLTRFTPTMAHHQILIGGGGAAGITAAAQLRRARPSLQIAVLEPAAEHCYQPGWTLVGGLFSEGWIDWAGLIASRLTYLQAKCSAIPRECRPVARFACCPSIGCARLLF